MNQSSWICFLHPTTRHRVCFNPPPRYATGMFSDIWNNAVSKRLPAKSRYGTFLLWLSHRRTSPCTYMFCCEYHTERSQSWEMVEQSRILKNTASGSVGNPQNHHSWIADRVMRLGDVNVQQLARLKVGTVVTGERRDLKLRYVSFPWKPRSPRGITGRKTWSRRQTS